MYSNNTVQISSSPYSNRKIIKRFLINVFAVELLYPSNKLWLVSPYISDIEILDNRSGNFSSVYPSFERKILRLSEIFYALSEKGTQINIVLRPDSVNDAFRKKLAALSGNIRINAREIPEVHEKGLLSDSFYISGSMNFTFRGVHINYENITISCDLNDIQRAQLYFEKTYRF